MESLFPVVVFLAIATLGAALARRLGLLAPIVLVVLGLALSFVPGFPQVELDPELVLIGILPPLLYVAALETSVPAFKNNIRPILLLAVGLVLFTAFVVGLVLHLLLPQLPFAICLALGAVVAPPDAVAATAVARRVGPAPPGRHHPGGREPGQRRHRAGAAAGRDDGHHRLGGRRRRGRRRGAAGHRRRHPDRGARRRWCSASCTGGSPTRCWTTRCR